MAKKSVEFTLTKGEIKRAKSFIRKVTGIKNVFITAYSTTYDADHNRMECRLEVCEENSGGRLYPIEYNWFYWMSDLDDRRRGYAYYYSGIMYYGVETSKAKKQKLM